MTIHSNHDPLQQALFKAAKVGNIYLMKEFIATGANPFKLDEEEHDAIFYALLSVYAMRSDPVRAGILLLEIAGIVTNFRKRS